MLLLLLWSCVLLPPKSSRLGDSERLRPLQRDGDLFTAGGDSTQANTLTLLLLLLCVPSAGAGPRWSCHLQWLLPRTRGWRGPEGTCSLSSSVLAGVGTVPWQPHTNQRDGQDSEQG